MSRIVRYLRELIGVGVVAAVLLIPWLALDMPAPANCPPDSGLRASLRRYFAGQRRTLWLHFAQPTELAIGDPIFVHESGPEQPIFLRRVGEIQGLYDGGRLLPLRRADVTQVRALIYPSAPALVSGLTITYRTKPQSAAWVVGLLLTPERQARIAQELENALTENRAELVTALRPIAEQVLQELFAVLEQDTPVALARHEAQWAALGDKYRREILAKQLIPLVKQEILPIALKRAEPVARQVGQELWQRLSLFRLGWRWVYDLSPLPEKNLAAREWDRFVEQEVLPIFEKHADDFAAIIKDVIRDLAQSVSLQAAVRSSLAMAADDQELHELLHTLFDDVVLDNPHFHEVLEAQLSAPRARQALNLASSRLEPVLHRIGDMIFGTRATGITPEFAQVLRSEILDKDHRWLLLNAPMTGGEAPTNEVQTVEVRLAGWGD